MPIGRRLVAGTVEATDAKSEVQALTNEWENQTLKAR